MALAQEWLQVALAQDWLQVVLARERLPVALAQGSDLTAPAGFGSHAPKRLSPAVPRGRRRGERTLQADW
ncbi:hypothetical protein Ssi02_00850 [Sinosporangium siamense]|uniref:Uncharacterized protein n=1 Tax=Sinosporangium siamense TaxID=1367973 RepID=A0A919V975_9ACTN|nr:hypothetical protein Ssi02_00850 [Sinosporangium siamense]